LIEFILSNLIRDLPVHCVRSQIAGIWKFDYSEPQLVKSGHEKKCGHKEPDFDQESWKAFDKNIDESRFPNY